MLEEEGLGPRTVDLDGPLAAEDTTDHASTIEVFSGGNVQILSTGEHLDGEFWELPESPAVRKFSYEQGQQLLRKMKACPSVATVFRFKEFPYNRGGRLVGEDREVEREYWLRLSDDVDKRCVPDTTTVFRNPQQAGGFFLMCCRPRNFPC